MPTNNRLSNLSKMWKTVKPISPSFSVVEDGQHVASLKSMTMNESKKSGRLQVISEYEIADGEFLGKTVRRFDGLDDETSVGYFKGYCEIIGFDIPQDAESLESEMSTFVENCKDLFDMVLKTNNGFQNVYVNQVSEYTLGEETEETEEAEEVEAVEEVEEQQVVVPVKKTVVKVASKPIEKVAPKPVALQRGTVIRKK